MRELDFLNIGEWSFFKLGCKVQPSSLRFFNTRIWRNDDLLRDAETFLSLAEEALGVPAQPLLPLRSAG